ncbi:phage/plasmid replication protein, II/X family [Actinobacillus equuli subsp. equuli]|uniref:Phage/plasmid replication protein, II/X family n=1 Tax=Actinobacillus equuli subsp. equuli TaxID=202947 RepID=A0A9X4JF95_ACTEU|nr:phage/plasmid replication protein, II/X family [Actinobacillus equuli]MDE8035789.1 phage/plasmid replication protein, II/X family [Actinobacillus equuli subsp. equuli]
MNYHIDWLTIEQDFGFEIPESTLASIFDFGVIGIHLDTGEVQQGIRTGKYRHKGSYCDEVSIKVSGSVIRMEGNPSRWNKVENVLGFTDIDSCVSCFNNILFSLKLPLFTRCTDIFHGQGKDGEKVRTFSNGAIIKRLDITTNKAVGRGNERTFLKALSQMRYRNSIGRLHTNGCTTDWLSEKGNANLIYPSCYIKHEELRIHSYDKIKNKFGEDSKEFKYYKSVYDYCEQNGVVRFEQKLKSRYLQREGLCYWGLSDFSKLSLLQEEFINMHKKLSVSKIELETIAEQLVSQGVVDTLRKANTSAFYAMKWASGEDLSSLSTATFKRHRANLRKIGIDIASPCDIDKFKAVQVISCEQIFVKPFKAPDFYQYPSNMPKLRLVA